MKLLISFLYSFGICAPAQAATVDSTEFSDLLPKAAEAFVTDALRKIDFGEEAMAKAPHILFVSAESTAVTGTEITNRIHFFQQGKRDVWIMRQRQTNFEDVNPETWSLVSIVVDHASRPATAYFLEFAPSAVNGLPKPIMPRVPCLRCHPNGPRYIRPMRSENVPVLNREELSILAGFNRRVERAGVIVGHSPILPSGRALLDESYRAATDPLLLPKCHQCHNAKNGSRNELQRQNAPSIVYLTNHSRDAMGYVEPVLGEYGPDMPIDDERLTEKEIRGLDAWFRNQSEIK